GFLDSDFVRVLRHHDVALVFADAVDWPYAEDVTADFLYLRLHGSEELYTSGYDDEALDRWAARIRLWSRGAETNDATLIDTANRPHRAPRDACGDFANDAQVRAAVDAQALRERARSS